MGTIKLATASGGSCVLSPTNTASDKTITVPAVDGTMAVADSGGRIAPSSSTNTGLGYQALNSNSGSNNTAVGYQAGYSNTTGADNTYTGYQAGNVVTTGIRNALFGHGAGSGITTGSYNTGIGSQTFIGTVTGSENTAVGYGSSYSMTSGNYNTAIGRSALFSNTTASNNTAVGYQAGYAKTTGDYNAFFGASAGANATTGQYNVCLGWYAGISVFNITTESNRVVIGTSNVTNAYIQVAWTVTSDARDKTDISDAPYGLAFVDKLRPVTYKWDKRDKYENKTPDGTHKETKTNIGFLAQDVIALEKEFGATDKDLLVADDEQEDNLKITESKMIPVLVKAIQELKAEVDTLKAKLGEAQ